MANISRPAGLSPLEYLDGNPWNGQALMCYIPQADTNAYAIGDPVTNNFSTTADSSGVPAVVLCTAGTGNTVLGPIVGMGGVIYGGPGTDPTSPNSAIIPATKTKAYYVLVATDPNLVYSIQEGGSGNCLTAATAVWYNFNLKSGTNSGYVSGWTLDNASSGSGSTIQLQVIGAVQASDNLVPTTAVAAASYTRWKVRINNHAWNAGSTGA
jgi:hypothetical protein